MHECSNNINAKIGTSVMENMLCNYKGMGHDKCEAGESTIVLVSREERGILCLMWNCLKRSAREVICDEL